MVQISADFMKNEARKQGFTLCGIAKSELLSIEKERFEKAINQNLHANKAYLERDIDKRFQPELLLDNCKSVIVCGFNYNKQKSRTSAISAALSTSTLSYQKIEEQCFDFVQQPKAEKREEIPLLLKGGVDAKRTVWFAERRFSQYVQIKDYHIFMKERLEALARSLQEEYRDLNYKITVDSSVISEKAWAVHAGIGYYGKNGIIQTKYGSFVFLGCLLLDIDVDVYDNPNLSSCGNCGRCIGVCPTNAIVAPYQVDSNLCISNINLNKNETDFTRITKYGWLIGCDECQNVCPNNENAPVNEEEISLRASYVEKQEEVLANLNPESFEQYFKDTAIYKLKYEGLKKRLKDFSV